ncbi:MAG: hypothetical protein PHV02_10330 [Rhodocyclaceae bacterium]|nr:hypothetical protein [Rhodocyclaceae bacterium]
MKLPPYTAIPATSDDAPRLTQAEFNQAQFKITGQDASKAEWQTALRAKTGEQHHDKD